ncbi:MAG TPA: hypothetical protein VFC40_00975 [Syntrophomonas sp.]|nr:hypothetical protein [Syntrophomonas sp.]
MQDDYSKSADGCQDMPKDPFSVNAEKLLLKSQFPPSLCKTLDDVNQVLQNSSNQKLKQDISKHLSATGGNIELLDDLLPDILYKLYGLLELWRP